MWIPIAIGLGLIGYIWSQSGKITSQQEDAVRERILVVREQRVIIVPSDVTPSKAAVTRQGPTGRKVTIVAAPPAQAGAPVTRAVITGEREEVNGMIYLGALGDEDDDYEDEEYEEEEVDYLDDGTPFLYPYPYGYWGGGAFYSQPRYRRRGHYRPRPAPRFRPRMGGGFRGGARMGGRMGGGFRGGGGRRR